MRATSLLVERVNHRRRVGQVAGVASEARTVRRRQAERRLSEHSASSAKRRVSPPSLAVRTRGVRREAAPTHRAPATGARGQRELRESASDGFDQSFDLPVLDRPGLVVQSEGERHGGGLDKLTPATSKKKKKRNGLTRVKRSEGYSSTDE